MSHRTTPNVGLSYLSNVERAHDPRLDAELLEGVLHRQGVDHRREHAHVVGARAVHALSAPPEPAKDVAPSDHERDLCPERDHVGDLAADLSQCLGVDPVARVTAERLPGELEHDTTNLQLSHGTILG